MTMEKPVELVPRAFTRREKTSIRQDVKRFEKIGRDHGCVSMEDFAHFVSDRVKSNSAGGLTSSSKELIRGLAVYFGEQLLYNTTLARLAVDFVDDDSTLRSAIAWHEENPGGVLVDRFAGQSVFAPSIILERLDESHRWPVSLDEILDQIIDWNHGYLFREEVETLFITGEDIEPDASMAA
ncbi:hypothetical protein GCM10009720_26200 [Yaniella flava]|uniref:Uncharacterized protein n=1 Tax=Yaniella flava TaxID=287930 RepID=A0ABN2UVR7_9MICC